MPCGFNSASSERGSPFHSLGVFCTAPCWHNLFELLFALLASRIMTRDIRESDWKVLKQLHEVALNRFCQQALSDIEGIVTDTSRTPHQRYIALYEIVQRRDKEIVKVFDNLKRSTAFLQIAALRSRHLLESEEFLRFSEETRALVEVFLENHA